MNFQSLQIWTFPCSQLRRLQRSRQDLAMMFVSFWISARCRKSRRDWQDLTKIGEVSPRLQRSPHDVCGFLKSRWDRSEIFYIAPRLTRSRHDVRVFLNLSKISPRSCQDFERQISFWDCLHLAEISPRVRKNKNLTKIAEIVENTYSPRSIPERMSNCFVVDH